MTAVAAVAVAAAILVASWMFKKVEPLIEVARHLVYTAITANESAIVLPEVVLADLQSVARERRSVAVTRIEFDGSVTSKILDLTARIGPAPTDPPITLPERAAPVIAAKLAELQREMNVPAASGGHALYAGLTRTVFSAAATTIVSSGLDLSAPVDFRDLNWSTPADRVVENVKRAGVQPALKGPVTFVVVPSAGDQPQLGQAERDYRNGIWRPLLMSAGATSVAFIEAAGATPVPSAPEAPTVAVPGLPPTPILPKPTRSGSITCTIPGALFGYKHWNLIDPGVTAETLKGCIAKALKVNATFEIHGWASYEGQLNPDGSPAVDDPANRKLSKNRVNTIAALLIDKLGVPADAITKRVGHGNTDLPDPGNPRGPGNRIVRITYKVKTHS